MLGIRLTDSIEALIGAPVATIRPTATLREAADALVADGVGLLVVVDAQAVRGVLSERDVVAAVADDVDLEVARVRDHATTDLVQLDERATVLDAAAAMAGSEVRHLAVHRDGVITGVVSLRDVVQVLLAERAADADAAR